MSSFVSRVWSRTAGGAGCPACVPSVQAKGQRLDSTNHLFPCTYVVLSKCPVHPKEERTLYEQHVTCVTHPSLRTLKHMRSITFQKYGHWDKIQQHVDIKQLTLSIRCPGLSISWTANGHTTLQPQTTLPGGSTSLVRFAICFSQGRGAGRGGR